MLLMMQIKHVRYIYITAQYKQVDKLHALGNKIISFNLLELKHPHISTEAANIPGVYCQ